MGLLLLGLCIGAAAGYFFGRRQATATPLPDTAPPLPRIAAAPVIAPPAPSKKARRLGISEGDFVPADDILVRMQEAWEQGEPLDAAALEAQAAAAAATAPVGDDGDGGLDDEPDPASLPDPVESERVRRVLARLEGQPPKGAEEAEPPGTVTEAVAALAADGYGDDLHLDSGHLACSSCGASHPTEAVEVDRVLRFEGDSDPGDEAMVLALRCPACGTKGCLVSAFGADADPDLAQAFVYLSSQARHR